MKIHRSGEHHHL